MSLQRLAILVGGVDTIVTLSIVFIPPIVRVTETVVTRVRNMDFIEATRASGVSAFQIIRFHVLGNIAGPILVYATSLCSLSIILASDLSFLGLGIRRRRLLRSTVHAGMRGAALQTIEGSPLDLRALPRGCAFSPRCGLVEARCLTAPPELRPSPGGELAAYVRIGDRETTLRQPTDLHWATGR